MHLKKKKIYVIPSDKSVLVQVLKPIVLFITDVLISLTDVLNETDKVIVVFL